MISRLRNQSETMQFPLRQRRLGTVAAVIEVVNELESSVFPSLHHLNSFTSSSTAATVRRCWLEMPKNGDATGIVKSKLAAYRCSRGSSSRSRDCSKNVIVSRKRSDVSDSWSRHVLNPGARFGVNDAEDGLARAVGRGYVKSIVAGVEPNLIATADLCDHIEDTPIDGIHDVRSAARRYEQALKWPEHDAIHAAGAAGYPIFLGYPHASGIYDSHVWRRRRHSHE